VNATVEISGTVDEISVKTLLTRFCDANGTLRRGMLDFLGKNARDPSEKEKLLWITSSNEDAKVFFINRADT
jgi:hypothetical protein